MNPAAVSALELSCGVFAHLHGGEQHLVKQVQVHAVCGEWPKHCLSAGKALILITEPKGRVRRRLCCSRLGVGVTLHRVGTSGPLFGGGSRGGTQGLRAGDAAGEMPQQSS